MHTLMCLRAWSKQGLIKGSDIKAALVAEVAGEEDELPAGDAIRGL